MVGGRSLHHQSPSVAIRRTTNTTGTSAAVVGTHSVNHENVSTGINWQPNKSRCTKSCGNLVEIKSNGDGSMLPRQYSSSTSSPSRSKLNSSQNQPGSKCNRIGSNGNDNTGSGRSNGSLSLKNGIAKRNDLPSPPAPELSPEIFFLIREHARALAAINKITSRLDELEHKVENICLKVVKMEKQSTGNQASSTRLTSKKGDNATTTTTTGTTANHLSDDSGGEYSRTTTGTGADDDELLSLLNQIAKFSDTIKQTQQQQSCNAIYAPLSAREQPQLQQHQQTIPESGLYGYIPIPMTAKHSKRVSPHSPRKIVTPLPGQQQQSSSSTLPQHPKMVMMNGPDSSGSQSFSALLFESNFDHFLDNLDMVTDPVGVGNHHLHHTDNHHHHNKNHHHQQPILQAALRILPIRGNHILPEILQHQQQVNNGDKAKCFHEIKSNEQWINQSSSSSQSPSTAATVTASTTISSQMNHVDTRHRSIPKPGSQSEIPKPNRTSMQL